MALTESDRLAIEVRDLLVQTKNKDQVTKVLINRGMDPDEARAWVCAIVKAIFGPTAKPPFGQLSDRAR